MLSDWSNGTGKAYAFSKSLEAPVPAQPSAVFALLDDPLRLGRHMTRPSAMMLGGSMRYALDPQGGRAIGSIIRVEGSVLGLSLSIVEKVIERNPPHRKVWETIEEPRLLVFGCYRLGFEISSAGAGSRVRIVIAYDLPSSGLGRVLGLIGAHIYARWCIQRMLRVADGAGPEGRARA